MVNFFAGESCRKIKTDTLRVLCAYRNVSQSSGGSRPGVVPDFEGVGVLLAWRHGEGDSGADGARTYHIVNDGSSHDSWYSRR